MGQITRKEARSVAIELVLSARSAAEAEGNQEEVRRLDGTLDWLLVEFAEASKVNKVNNISTKKSK